MLASDNNDDYVLGEAIIKNMHKFHSAVTLQKATLAFITNQFGQIEEITRLKYEFDKIDTNKDGVISKGDLSDCLKKVYPIQAAIQKVEEFTIRKKL